MKAITINFRRKTTFERIESPRFFFTNQNFPRFSQASYARRNCGTFGFINEHSGLESIELLEYK